MQTLCLSFWNVVMSNLPVGIIRKRVLSTDEARSLIHQARAGGTLLCVAEDDLGAPYHARERKRQEELCTVLRRHADIEISLKDFFGDQCANPLCFAQIDDERSLLVVDCHYTLDRDAARRERTHLAPTSSGASKEQGVGDVRASLHMSLAPDTIAFYLLEKVIG